MRFVYHGDNSAFPVGPGAAQRMLHLLRLAGSRVGGDAVQRPLGLRAVHRGRRRHPAGGLFTGAEGVKTAAEAEIYGGTAGQPYDPCYHLFCDTFANNSMSGLDEMSDAAAHVALTLAKRNMVKDPLANPPAA